MEDLDLLILQVESETFSFDAIGKVLGDLERLLGKGTQEDELIDAKVVKLALSLIAKRPAEFKSEIADCFVNFLKRNDRKTSRCFVTVDNLLLLTESNDKRTSWLKFEAFLTKCLISNAITPQELEIETLLVLKHEFDETTDTLHRFSSCLTSVIDSYKRSQSNNYREDQFLEILDWLAWFCHEEQAI